MTSLIKTFYTDRCNFYRGKGRKQRGLYLESPDKIENSVNCITIRCFRRNLCKLRWATNHQRVISIIPESFKEMIVWLMRKTIVELPLYYTGH